MHKKKQVKVTVRYPHIHGYSKRTIECDGYAVNPKGELALYHRNEDLPFIKFAEGMWCTYEVLS